jgi:nitrogen-specific signal transduction histidine kinase
MKAADDDLMATSDAILEDTDRLRALELEKRTLRTSDPRMDKLSAEIVSLAERVRTLATAEKEIALETEAER